MTEQKSSSNKFILRSADSDFMLIKKILSQYNTLHWSVPLSAVLEQIVNFEDTIQSKSVSGANIGIDLCLCASLWTVLKLLLFFVHINT